MQGGTDSSEFRIPDSELEGSVELRVPSPQPSRLTPVPSDKILLPRRMLVRRGRALRDGRRGRLRPGLSRRPRRLVGRRQGQAPTCRCRESSGKVLAGPANGREAGRRGGRRDCLARRQVARQAVADCRSAARRSAAGQGRCHVGRAGRVRRRHGPGRCLRRLHAFCPGRRELSDPDPLAHATREPSGPLEQRDIAELGNYFDAPADLLQRCRYRWLTKDLRRDAGPIDVEFTE